MPSWREEHVSRSAIEDIHGSRAAADEIERRSTIIQLRPTLAPPVPAAGERIQYLQANKDDRNDHTERPSLPLVFFYSSELRAGNSAAAGKAIALGLGAEVIVDTAFPAPIQPRPAQEAAELISGRGGGGGQERRERGVRGGTNIDFVICLTNIAETPSNN